MDKNICDSTTHLSIIGGSTYENGKRKYKLLFHDRSSWFSERLIRRKYPLLLINFLESNITFAENDSPSDHNSIDYENDLCKNFTNQKIDLVFANHEVKWSDARFIYLVKWDNNEVNFIKDSILHELAPLKLLDF
jgi:hypothetical protein